MAKFRKNPWASENSLPIREIDGTIGGGDDAPNSEDSSATPDGTVRSIVPAPRPFAYREPIDSSEPEDPTHPRRRHTD